MLRMTENATAAPTPNPFTALPSPHCRSLLTSCQGGNTARLGVHSKQVLKQRGDHIWHHIQQPYGSYPYFLSTILGTLWPMVEATLCTRE